MPRLNATLRPSPNSRSKWVVVVGGVDGKRSRTIHFGAVGYEDYTMHKDPLRKQRYLTRHRSREDWTNVFSAGFWSRWLLWNLPTLLASIRDTQRRFPGLRIVRRVT
jgi:hypothetical protein